MELARRRAAAGSCAAWPARLPLASSSIDEEQASVERTRVIVELARNGLDPAVLEAFHRSHAPERGPFSPCMHRAEAATHSATHVLVSPERVAMRYAPGAPCETPFGPPLGITRPAVGGAAR